MKIETGLKNQSRISNFVNSIPTQVFRCRNYETRIIAINNQMHAFISKCDSSTIKYILQKRITIHKLESRNITFLLHNINVLVF